MAVAESEAGAQSAQAQRPIALWVVPVSGLGGVARHVLDVATAGLPGYELVVLSPEGPLAAELRDRGARVAVGKFGPDFGVLASIRTLRTAAQRLRPAVVHSHLAYADVIVAATPLPPGTVRVTTEHGIAGDDQVYHRTAAKSKIMAAVHTVRLRRFGAVIAVAEATKRAMMEKWAPRQEIHVILNGVDPRLDSVREPSATGPLRILALARLSPEKRIPQLLRAFQLVLESRPDASLTIAGVGELEAELKALAAELGITHAVAFPGFVDPDAAMLEADVLAQLSVWENCSYSLLDAANRGMRVVASRVGGNPEIVSPRGLVDADDVEAVAGALLDEHATTHLDSWPTVTQMSASIARAYPQGQPRKASGVFNGVTIATNNGDIGGGEVMLLQLAEVLSEIGREVRIVGPSQPNGLVVEATKRGFEVVTLEADDRLSWMRALRGWHAKNADELLWCNGLVPALSTVGRGTRVVHLHQLPRGRAQALAVRIARVGARMTVVPSVWMSERISGSLALLNWTTDHGSPLERMPSTDVTRIGFLGRPSISKGVDVLARAVEVLNTGDEGAIRLVIGGEARFVDEEDQARVTRALAPIADLVDEVGWVEPREFFRRIDLLVVPSVWPESFGLVAAEAMSARMPVLVSNAGALPEIVGNREDRIFEAGNVEALVTAVRRHLASGPSFDQREDYDRWRREYSPQSAAVRVRDLLNRIEKVTPPTKQRLQAN